MIPPTSEGDLVGIAWKRLTESTSGAPGKGTRMPSTTIGEGAAGTIQEGALRSLGIRGRALAGPSRVNLVTVKRHLRHAFGL